MKALTTVLLLVLLCTILQAEDFMKPSFQPRISTQKILERYPNPSQARPDTLDYQFSINPLNLLLSYYDYMIGSYNNLPLWKNPDPTYGGYFLTFHGKRTPTGQRRIFYTHISDTGVIENMSDPPWPMAWEGYPSLAVDDIAGKPLLAWHVNWDGDTDPNLEVVFVYDAYLFGSVGQLSYPQVIINNPITLPPPYNTTDNEFIWPTVQTGPSPITGMRRVYVLARNTVSHAGNPSGNVYIVYADFNASMLESNATLSWNYTTIPFLDAWNNDTVLYRRPHMAFSVGNDGRIYYSGYHTSAISANYSDLIEPDLDVFFCDNYGTGTWTRVTGSSEYGSWNPLVNYGNGPLGFFTGSDNITPVPSDSLYWGISNSSHINAVMDAANSEIHMAAVWAQQFRENDAGVLSSFYHPTMQTVKNLVYDIDAETFSIREIYPVAGNSVDNLMWLPWDADGDGWVDEYYTDATNPNNPDNGTPLMSSTWPFPYWDNTAHAGAMMFHLNSTKITPPNAEGMMAVVWQDSDRARKYNTWPTEYPEYSAFADTPEIWISCSPDYGITWSEPTSLNKVETPQLAGMKPMYVYPANQIKYIGVTGEGKKIGKLGIMFYDDISWGSYQLEGPICQNDGGYVRFMELEITFPLPITLNNEPVITPAIIMLKQNYPNPFNPETTISFNMSKAGLVDLSIYNVKGQLVKTLYTGYAKTGENDYYWDGTDQSEQKVSSGLYFYKLKADGRTEVRKMMLMK